MTKKMLPLAVVASCGLWAGAQQTLSIPKSAKLIIISRGSVRITGESRGDVLWQTDSEKVASHSTSSPQYVKLWLDQPGAIIDIRVPRSQPAVIVELSQGDIEAYELEGEFSAKTGAGRIKLDRLKMAMVRSGGGEIRVGNVAKMLKCFLGAGPIHVESAGESSLETNGGEIWMRQSSGPVFARSAGGSIHIERAGGAVEANTGSGIVMIGSAAGPVTARTGSGSIQISGATGARCESGGGAIRLKGIKGGFQASTKSGTILVEVPEHSPLETSMLRTGMGDIVVLIPSKLVVTVDAMSMSGGRPARIVSEFPEILVRPAWMDSVRVTQAVGSINGGGPLLKIEATGGTIFLRKK